MAERNSTKDLRTDDRGISLLEVILAVMIFSVLALILIRGFVTAGNTTKKAGRQQRAGNAAQNIMEELKAKELEELALEFHQPVDPVSGVCRVDIQDVSEQEIRDGSVIFREVNSQGQAPAGFGSIRFSEDGKSYTFLGQKKGRYYFEILGLKSGGESYDALITLDGVNDRIYKDDFRNKVNNYETPNIGNLNIYEHAFLVLGTPQMQGTIEYQAFADIIKKQQSALDSYLAVQSGGKEVLPLDAGDLYEKCRRTIEISLEKDAGSLKAVASYRLYIPGLRDGTIVQEGLGVTDFACPGNSADGSVHDGRGGCFCTDIIDEQVFYDNSETGSDLLGIYLFYVPNYNSVSESDPLDQIVFDNYDNVQVPLFVTKQLGENQEYEDVRVQEQNYKMSLTIREDPPSTWNTLASQFQGATSLKTNLDTNIGYESLNDRDKNAAPRQMKLVYEDRYKKNRSGTVAKSITQMNGLEDAQEKYRLFAAKVALYPEGTLTGQKQDAWDLSLLYELEGSLED